MIQLNNLMSEQFIYVETPLGRLIIASDGKYVTRAAFCPASWEQKLPYRETLVLKQARRQLGEYFAGERRKFELPLKPFGTPFQQQVWKYLLQIPYGTTRNYKEVALGIGKEKAARAVGNANHVNPIVIFIPCHRVIGADGGLTGYAGGLERKKFLLELEQKILL